MYGQRERHPTLVDVARRAGVSTATVSRCLNAPDRVSAPTRESVLRAVREIGYAPNYAAQVLAANRSNTFGAIIPTMDNAVFARGVQAFQEELGDAGINLLIASSAYSAAREAEQIRTLVARGADALMLIGYHRGAETYAFLERRGVPVLVTWTYSADGPCPSVGFDNRRAMRSLVDEVLALGHTRLAMITATTADNDRAAARVAGLRDAAAAAGLDPDAVPIVETTYSIHNGRAAMAELMRRKVRPTAVCCGNDVLAVGALSEARAQGLKVPADVSITGFDDIEIAEVAVPALTTVHVPHRKMGRSAAVALTSMVQSGDGAKGIELPTSLVLRSSLGPPGA